MDVVEAKERVLDAAEGLFYNRGIQAVGMDELRDAAGVSLKRLYQCFPAKQDLVEECLRRRDGRWRSAVVDYVAQHAETPEDRVLAVFDWLHTLFAKPGFRGCAFVNSFGELGAIAPGVADVARAHHGAVKKYLARLAGDMQVNDPEGLAERLWLLVIGASAGAAITGNPGIAEHARGTADTLVAAAKWSPPLMRKGHGRRSTNISTPP